MGLLFIVILCWLYISYIFLQLNVPDEADVNDIITALLSPIILLGFITLIGIFNFGNLYMWNSVFDTIYNGEDLDLLQIIWLLSE